jgi:hypothetical protein
MTDHTNARSEIEELLATMLDADGYAGVIRSWPETGIGHAEVEVVASPGACEDCLVPKGILAMVLSDNLPDGISLETTDLTYPSDRVG